MASKVSDREGRGASQFIYSDRKASFPLSLSTAATRCRLDLILIACVEGAVVADNESIPPQPHNQDSPWGGQGPVIADTPYEAPANGRTHRHARSSPPLPPPPRLRSGWRAEGKTDSQRDRGHFVVIALSAETQSPFCSMKNMVCGGQQ